MATARASWCRRRGDGVRLGPKTATRAFLVTANDYSATFDPEAEGQWEIVINIDSERGPETLTLPVTVIPGRGFPWTALIAGLGLVLPIVWLAWGAVRRKGRAKASENMKPEHTMNRLLPALTAVLVVALGLAACGGGSKESLTFELSVVGGELSGESDTFVVKQGDDVTLNVSADIAGVFHVHGYDLRARVDANGSGDDHTSRPTPPAAS